MKATVVRKFSLSFLCDNDRKWPTSPPKLPWPQPPPRPPMASRPRMAEVTLLGASAPCRPPFITASLKSCRASPKNFNSWAKRTRAKARSWPPIAPGPPAGAPAPTQVWPSRRPTWRPMHNVNLLPAPAHVPHPKSLISQR